MLPELEKPNVTEIQVRIDCNGCVHKIKKALHQINGIYDIYIDIPQQKLTVIGWADPEKIIKAIKKTRKTATICSHTAAMESESSPEDGAPSSYPENHPGEEGPPTELPDPVSTGSTTFQPRQYTGSKEVEEVNVVYHHPPDHQDSVGVYGGWVDHYPGGGGGGGGHGGPGFKHMLPQPIHVNQSYNKYNPTPYVTEYEYIRPPPHYTPYSKPEPPPPPRYTTYSWPEPQQYTHYSRPEPPQQYSQPEPPQHHRQPGPPQHYSQPESSPHHHQQGPALQHYSQPGSPQQQNQTNPPQQQSQPRPPQHYRQPGPPQRYRQPESPQRYRQPESPQRYRQPESPQHYRQRSWPELQDRPAPPPQYTEHHHPELPQHYTQYHRLEPPQPYTQYNFPEPPQQYTQHDRVEPSSLHTYYSRLEPPDHMHYNDDYQNSNMNDDITSAFGDDDPNGCRIV
ncbi:extensin-3-like [Cynara cardunculus var. scolymus]|uniref:extensin-3-like n=1 Tax=Cynara cardunculus var. scolymus TaxID=59895 RepID=UPI000D62611E|nr:extensin-3-like [Cynara cardunculus var. scolymus]